MGTTGLLRERLHHSTTLYDRCISKPAQAQCLAGALVLDSMGNPGIGVGGGESPGLAPFFSFSLLVQRSRDGYEQHTHWQNLHGALGPTWHTRRLRDFGLICPGQFLPFGSGG